MKPCKQCTECMIYKELWCNACKYKYTCKIRKNMTKEHRIKKGCIFDCTDIKECQRKEQ